MKVFTFDPATGARGDHIGDLRRASWTSQAVSFQVERGLIEPIEYVEPYFGDNAQVVVHVDAGVGIGDERSYRHPTEWRCFCLGEFFAGDDHCWEWVILPPSSLVREIHEIAYDPQPGDNEALLNA